MDEAGRPEHDPVGLRLDAFDIAARGRSASGPDGRLGLPKTAHWPIFPFETDGLRVRLIEDPVVPEPPRRGETADDCWTCRAPEDGFVWSDERWLVSMPQEPQALPGAVLHPREHLDLDTLPDDLAGEMGVRLVRMERALSAIHGVGRVHLYRWGDGGAHLHVLVVARPLGMMQLRGMFLTTWLHTLPPLGIEQWTAMRTHVGSSLEAAGGPPGG